VPADGGTPKVCRKCKLWFSQQPRERVCDGCRPNYVKARKTASQAAVNAVNAQVTGRQKAPLDKQICLELAAEAAQAEHERSCAQRERAYLRLVHKDAWPSMLTFVN